jgi:hypothetical protein
MYQTNNPEIIYWQNQAIEWAPRVIGALAILVVTWILARATKWAFAKMINRIPLLQRHNAAEPSKTLGGMIGEIVFWLILLVGILLALQPLGLSQVMDPVRELTTTAFAAVPQILKAVLIMIVTVVVANISRHIIEGSLLVANADGWLARTGLVVPPAGLDTPPAESPAGTASRRPSISRAIGLIVFSLIMIVGLIGAFEALQIEAISGPATEMLNIILQAIPRVFGAVLLLAFGYFVGRLAKDGTEQILPSMGFDRSVSALGFTPASTSTSTPSRTVGTIVMVAIVIFFAIKAAELLQSPIIAVMLAQVLELGSRILFGTGIIIGGVVIARIVSNLVAGAGSESWLPAILRWSIIALAVAMGLRFMGLANEIVIIAFSSIIGSAAIACALAFGLGGRLTAHKLLEEWTAENRIPSPPCPPTPPKQPAEATPLREMRLDDDGGPPLV